MRRKRTLENVIDEVAHNYGQVVREMSEDTLDYLSMDGGPVVDSPIERAMFFAIRMSSQWFALGTINEALPAVVPPADFDDVDLSRLALPVIISPQYPIGPYRADFVLRTTGARVAVECDGHQFHERTKQQAQRDKERDRFFLNEGWPVLRFTGSEIWADPVKQGDDVASYLMAAEYRTRK